MYNKGSTEQVINLNDWLGLLLEGNLELNGIRTYTARFRSSSMNNV